MLKLRIMLAFLALSAFPALAAPSVTTDEVVARVNGRAILQSDLVREIDKARTEGRWIHDDNRTLKALDQALLQNLAAERAVAEKLDKDPVVARELQEVLARHYLDRKLQASGTVLNVGDEDVKTAYEKEPLIKIRHIAVFARNTDEKKEARERMRKVQKLLTAGERFQDLADKYSEDPASVPGGELDGRGVHNLPAPIYQSAVKLSVGKVSTVLELDNAYHMIQLVEKKPHAQAPTVYLELLRSRIRNFRKEQLLARVLAELRPGAKIDVAETPLQNLSRSSVPAVPLIAEEKKP